MRFLKFFLIFFVLVSTLNVSAWGYSIHTEVSGKVVELLDGDYYDFLFTNIDTVKAKSLEPDNMKVKDPAEYARHFDDSDIEHQDINVSSSSADYDLGVVSWAVLNSTYKLADAILSNNGNSILHWAGYLLHYATDATQPFHATSNFNGQLTGNDGIHSTFEINLVERYFEESFSNTSFEDVSVIDPYNETKKIIATGLAVVDDILKADDDARAGATTQDEYFGTLWAGTSDIMKTRIHLAIQHSASLLYTAYQIAISNGLSDFAPVITTPIPVTTSDNTTKETPIASIFLIILPIIQIVNRRVRNERASN